MIKTNNTEPKNRIIYQAVFMLYFSTAKTQIPKKGIAIKNVSIFIYYLTYELKNMHVFKYALQLIELHKTSNLR